MRRRKASFEGTGSGREAFADAEGLGATVAWRPIRAERDRRLGEAAIEALSARFDFSPEALRGFEIDLAIALDPEHAPANAPIDLAKAAALARASGASMHTRLVRAMEEVDEAHLLLDELDADPLEHGRARRRLRRLHEAMTAAHAALSDLVAEAGWIAANEDAAVLAIADPRRTGDLRRRHVLACIFTFWRRSGRPLTVTTDAVTNERRGALIAFTQAVVERITEPSASLSGETIRKDLELYRRANGA